MSQLYRPGLLLSSCFRQSKLLLYLRRVELRQARLVLIALPKRLDCGVIQGKLLCLKTPPEPLFARLLRFIIEARVLEGISACFGRLLDSVDERS